MAKTNYNFIAAAGKMDLTDEQVVEDLGLDPNLAGTPEINRAALNRTQERLKKNLEKKGMTPNEISTYADQARKDTIKQIRNAEKLSGMKLMT